MLKSTMLVVALTAGTSDALRSRPFTMAGFGPPPKAKLTLKEVCRTFKSRLPKDTSVPCACGNVVGGLPQTYHDCCRPYHMGQAVAETPEWCLRSRYAGFAYRLPAYIINTTASSNADHMKDKIAWAKKLNKDRMFDNFEFVKLDVGEFEAGGADDEAYLVPNKFTLQPKDALSQPPLVMMERTKFVRTKSGAWQFAEGAVTSDAVGFKGQVLESEDGVKKFEKDVDFVTRLIDKKV